MERESNFKGFKKEAFSFIKEIKERNSKEWFKNNEVLYNQLVVTPLKCIVADMGSFINEIDDKTDVTPSVGKTISRIYRDTRFSKDKSLFRDTLWIVFKRKTKEYLDTPAYFFEISPEQYRFGMGFYSPDAQTMTKYREMIDNDEDEFLNVINFYDSQEIFKLEGDKYKKSRALNKSIKITEWYDRKNINLICTRDIDETVLTDKLITELKNGYSQLSPLYHYLWRARENKN